MTQRIFDAIERAHTHLQRPIGDSDAEWGVERMLELASSVAPVCEIYDSETLRLILMLLRECTRSMRRASVTIGNHRYALSTHTERMVQLMHDVSQQLISDIPQKWAFRLMDLGAIVHTAVPEWSLDRPTDALEWHLLCGLLESATWVAGMMHFERKIDEQNVDFDEEIADSTHSASKIDDHDAELSEMARRALMPCGYVSWAHLHAISRTTMVEPRFNTILHNVVLNGSQHLMLVPPSELSPQFLMDSPWKLGDEHAVGAPQYYAFVEPLAVLEPFVLALRNVHAFCMPKVHCFAHCALFSLPQTTPSGLMLVLCGSYGILVYPGDRVVRTTTPYRAIAAWNQAYRQGAHIPDTP